MYVVQQRSPDRVQCLQINILEARQEISKHVLFPMIFALEYIYAILYSYSVYCLQYDKLFKLVSSLDMSYSTPRQDIPYAYRCALCADTSLQTYMRRFGDVNSVRMSEKKDAAWLFIQMSPMTDRRTLPIND